MLKFVYVYRLMSAHEVVYEDTGAQLDQNVIKYA